MNEALEKKIEEAIDFIEEDSSPIFILSHYDCDGLSSGLIISKLLYNRNIPFIYRIGDHKNIKEIKNSVYNRIIIIDLQFKESFLEILNGRRILIIDHHQFEKIKKEDSLIFLNPYKFGINGNNEVSSSVLSYLIARKFDESLVYLSPLALCGALEDKQDVNEKRTFKGINKEVLNEAEEAGIISKKLGIISYINFYESLVKSISLLFEPFIPQIFSDETATRNFLKNCNIKDNFLDKKISEINEEEQLKISQNIAKKLLKENFNPYYIERIYGYNYEISFKKINNLRFLAKILDFCGRAFKIDLITKFIILEKFNSELLEKIFKENILIIKKILLNIINYKKFKEYENIFFIKFDEEIAENFLGNFLSLILASNISNKKIFTAAFISKEYAKFSLRLKAIDEKINLGKITSEISKKIGGEGGGHLNSAGAYVPKESIENFIKELNNQV